MYNCNHFIAQAFDKIAGKATRHVQSGRDRADTRLSVVIV